LERWKILLAIVLGVASALIIWRVGFEELKSNVGNVGLRTSSAPNRPAGGPAVVRDGNEPRRVEPADVNAPGEPNRPADVNAPAEPNRPADVNAPAEPNRPADVNAPAEPNKPAEPNEPLESINLKNIDMRHIIEKLASWTGKVVIPTDEAMQVKLTIYSADKLPRSKALQMIYSALRLKGYVAEHTDNVIFLKPLKDAKLDTVPTIAPDQPLAAIENKSQVVQKFFQLKSYSPSQMGALIQPLIGEHGHVSADENTRSLLVIDTVANLMRIEKIVDQFDVPEAEETTTEIFELQHGDPAEIVQLLRLLLGGESSTTKRKLPGPLRPAGGSPSKGKTPGAATAVVVGPSQLPVVLIPEPRRKWIIAKASAEDMKEIREWIKKLDREEPVESEYETIPVTYADVREVAQRIDDALSKMPGTELQPSVLVRPLEHTQQIMVFGRKDLREMVKKLVEEVDVPAGQFETRHFPLKYADPDQVKSNIEELFSELTGRSRSYGWRPWDFYGSRRRTSDSDMVRVISYPSLKEVTVIASPENMEKIAEQIAEWDRPLDVEQVKPRIIELQNCDPVQMADLLNTLFSERSTGRMSFFDIMFGRTQSQQRIVGPLYGQLTFEDVPGTKKIIVISKIPEAYDVVEQLIRELDREEMAEVPRVVQLKYADPESLAERLNAMFNEPGTSARIRLSAQGLSSYSMMSDQDNQSASNQQNQNQEMYTPWWSAAGARSRVNEQMPISNVIGRVRFVPDTHSKSILVLAPPGFIDEIEQVIHELDIPGKQVMIKAVILEVDHSSLTSLGVQLASNPGDAFGTLEENAITALSQLKVLEERGSLTLNTTADITALVDFLIKRTNAKILNQQTLWTEDNEEASFFKGDRVAFQTDISTSGTGERVTSAFEFERVGMTLRTRPSITPEKRVEMVINIQLSQLTGDIVNGQPVRTEMESTTNVIVEDGQTIMLGGILFQKDSVIERKMPLLGDLPIIGDIFGHKETIEANNELIVFITPYVIDEPGELLPETVETMERPKQMLKDVRDQLDSTMEKMEQKLP